MRELIFWLVQLLFIPFPLHFSFNIRLAFQLDGRNVTVEKYPKGNFLGPTIITDMNTSMTAYKTEIFGPVLCVINVDTLDDAIQVTQGLIFF